MEIQGAWSKDGEGYMQFEDDRLQRMYELVTEDYYQVYNACLDELDDEEAAAAKAREAGYELLTDYKIIAGEKEFVTVFTTPAYTLEVWYAFDPVRRKKIFDRGNMRISSRQGGFEN